MDEIAAHVKADPVAHRLAHLSDPRLGEVLSAAAKAANWETRPSPKPGIPKPVLRQAGARPASL